MGKEQDLTPDEPEKPDYPDEPEEISVLSKANVTAKTEIDIAFGDPDDYTITLFTDEYNTLWGSFISYLDDSTPKRQEVEEGVIYTYTKEVVNTRTDVPDNIIYVANIYNRTVIKQITDLELDASAMGEAGNYTLNFRSTDTTGDITTIKYTIEKTSGVWSTIAFNQYFSYTTTEPEA
jgi:hypothetical protein